MAQALERLGERWGLLIVRDLLPGERRFTDLLQSCGGVTPRQLSARLKQLEEAGIVEVDRQAGRRDVWYRLSEAGETLKPTVEALLLWGVQHIDRPPVGDEPVLPYHLMNGTRLALDAASRQPRAPVRWTWRFPDEPQTLAYDGATWHLTPGEDPDADVVVDTTPRAWAELVAARGQPRGSAEPIALIGRAAPVREFKAAFSRLDPPT